MNIYPPQPVDQGTFTVYQGYTAYGNRTEPQTVVKTKPLIDVLQAFELEYCTEVLASDGRAWKRLRTGGWRAMRPKKEGDES